MPEDYTCDICGQTFDSRAELDLHVRKVGIVD